MRNSGGTRRTMGRLLAVAAFGTMPSLAGTVMFTDSFTPSASPLWSDTRGVWAASGGAYFAQNPNNNPLTFSGLPFDLTNFTVTVTVHNLGDGGIWLRSDAAGQDGVLLVTGGNGYGQGSRGGDAGNSLYWHVVQGGNAGPEFNAATGILTPGNTYTLTVVVNGDIYSAFVNGAPTPATSLTDSTFSNGYVGLYDDQPNITTGAGFGPAQSFSDFILQGSTTPSVPEPGTASLLYLAVVLTTGGAMISVARDRAARPRGRRG